jgi:hypothetical protein
VSVRWCPWRIYTRAAEVAAAGMRGPKAIVAAINRTLEERALGRARQVEEHYLRKTAEGRALNVRDRMEGAVQQGAIDKVAARLVGAVPAQAPRRVQKQTGLDDGVAM